MTDVVERLRATGSAVEPDLYVSVRRVELLDAAAEITRLRLRLADLEVSIAAFRQTVKDWEF